MKLLKKITISTITLSMILSLSTSVYAKTTEESRGPELTDYFTIIDENGIPQIVEFEDIPSDDSEIEKLADEFEAKNSEVVETVQTTNQTKGILGFFNKVLSFFNVSLLNNTNTKYTVKKLLNEGEVGIVYLKSKDHNGTNYLTYKNELVGGTGYTTGSYAKDAAFLGYTDDGKVRAMQAGCIMVFEPSDVDVISYVDATISYYEVVDGFLEHVFYYGSANASNRYRVGKNVPHLQAGIKYYSYDGHYFYTDYPTMIEDYKNNRRTAAVNANEPYYNYYQYLSHRTISTLSADVYNSITTNEFNRLKASDPNINPTKMENLGAYYMYYQNMYGTNALLMYGVSANESRYGTSKIAKDKNNLFGHGAVDSNPYYGANGYESPDKSIMYHSSEFVSKKYLDNEDWRYQGGHLGDKESGMNVRYASDPYWGEKAAAPSYYHNETLSQYGVYKIGIIEGKVEKYNLYKEASPQTSIHILGNTKNGVTSPVTHNLPVVILATVKGSDGKDWYKIQSDSALNNERTDMKWDNTYSYTRDYVYIPVDRVRIVHQGNGTIPSLPTVPELPNLEALPSYTVGDANLDNTVNSMDMYLIIQHILGNSILKDLQFKAADTNNDGALNSMDMYNVIQIILKK